MKSILNLLPSECVVLRNGHISKIASNQLVVGDIVLVNLGNKVPADIRLLHVSNDLKFDRAVLTGESDAIEGTVDFTADSFLETNNIALMGTHVVNGNGIGVVVLTGKYTVGAFVSLQSISLFISCTGNNTVMGRINQLTNSGKQKKTLIQQEISRFVRIIVSLTIVLVSILLTEWLAYVTMTKQQKCSQKFSSFRFNIPDS